MTGNSPLAPCRNSSSSVVTMTTTFANSIPSANARRVWVPSPSRFQLNNSPKPLSVSPTRRLSVGPAGARSGPPPIGALVIELDVDLLRLTRPARDHPDAALGRPRLRVLQKDLGADGLGETEAHQDQAKLRLSTTPVHASAVFARRDIATTAQPEVLLEPLGAPFPDDTLLDTVRWLPAGLSLVIYEEMMRGE